MTKTDRPRTPWWLYPTFALLAFVAWRVLTLGLADHWAESDPARALWWRGDHPEALIRLAEREVTDPARAADAERHAKAALRASPLDGRPYRILAQLADAAGDKPRAAELYTLAIRHSPRDIPSQAWLADWHLAHGEVAKALDRVDLMLRVRPALLKQIVPMLAVLAATPEAQAPFAAVLAKDPPWRASALVQIARTAESVDGVAPLFDLLRRQPDGLADTELAAWVDRLVADGQWGRAYLIWISALPPQRRERIGNVFNGGFEAAPLTHGFDWRFGRVPGARIDRLPVNGAGGRVALRVAFDDRRIPFAHVRQMLALPPGTYRFEGRAKPAGLRTERGLVWTLTCIPKPGTALAETDPLKGQGDWRDFGVDFTVPDGCGAQWMTLRTPWRIAAEQRLGGQAWFDDLRITRQ